MRDLGTYRQGPESGAVLLVWGRAAKALPLLKGFKTPRRTTHNKEGVRQERINHRVVPKGKFTKIEDMGGVLSRLFGDIRSKGNREIAGRALTDTKG